MIANGVDAKVEALQGRLLSTSSCVWSWSILVLRGIASIGSAARYNQDCDEIVRTAGTKQKLHLANSALKWIEQNSAYDPKYMNWNTNHVGNEKIT